MTISPRSLEHSSPGLESNARRMADFSRKWPSQRALQRYTNPCFLGDFLDKLFFLNFHVLGLSNFVLVVRLNSKFILCVVKHAKGFNVNPGTHAMLQVFKKLEEYEHTNDFVTATFACDLYKMKMLIALGKSNYIYVICL